MSRFAEALNAGIAMTSTSEKRSGEIGKLNSLSYLKCIPSRCLSWPCVLLFLQYSGLLLLVAAHYTILVSLKRQCSCFHDAKL